MSSGTGRLAQPWAGVQPAPSPSSPPALPLPKPGREESKAHRLHPWTGDSWGYAGNWPLVAELCTPENRFHKPPWVESSSGDVPRGGGHPSSCSLPAWEAGRAPGFLKLRPVKALREVRDATDPKHGVLSLLPAPPSPVHAGPRPTHNRRETQAVFRR